MLYTNPGENSNSKWALVTGASSGIGEAFARRLAGDRHNLFLVARREDRLRALAEELHSQYQVRAEVLPVDLSTEEGIERVAGEINDGPPLSILVSAAAFGTRAHFVEIPAERSEKMVRLHVQAGLRLTRAALPAMLEQRRGAIVHLSSLAALFTTSFYVTYSATKAFLNTFCEGLADEVGPHGVRVLCVCAGLTRTEFMNSPDFAEFSYKDVPERFWMSADQVAVESLQALRRPGPALFIPGAHNRAFVGVMRAPVIGPLARAAIDLLGGRKYY